MPLPSAILYWVMSYNSQSKRKQNIEWHHAMDNQMDEFQDSTSSLSNTETELNSTQQGYIKAITKLVRSIERANHHIQILTTAIDKKKPPRGLIPKLSPKIPDTPGKLIIKWKGIQQDPGLHLTETLREY